ncbi:hypothetical protein G5610_26195, partial [Escherichia coli]|uniref:hypothetical protein n=1 Tax=Escherichia coli TaxID=562 RepID=UPI0013D82C53
FSIRPCSTTGSSAASSRPKPWMSLATARARRPLRPHVPTLGSLTSLGQRVIARPSSRRARSFLPMPSARGRWRVTPRINGKRVSR